MTHPKLAIQLLGNVSITYDGQLIEIRRRMERALLYYLVVKDHPVSRSTLIDLFWPEADDVDPRAALRTALSRLRRELPDSDLLQTALDQVWIDGNKIRVDLLRFEDSFQSLKNILSAYREGQILPAQIVKQIKEALALWHGNSIIQGDDLTPYPELESWRQTLERKTTQHRKFLMKRLADHFQASGQLEPALNLYRRLGRTDVFDVTSHLSVLDILTRLGRHQEAIGYCDDLEDKFARKYNAPLPEALLERCQYSKLQIDSQNTQHGRVWPVPLTLNLNLVGREAELSQLQQAYYQGGMVRIEGVMGSGKSRLVQELFQTMAPKPTLFLALAQEMAHALPLAPIINALRRDVPEEIWHRIDSVWANQFCLLLPELAEIREDCLQTPVSQLPSGKQHLFEAIYRLLVTVARRTGRILFILEDAQWVDKQTLEAIAYLVNQGFFEDYGLLVITSRPEDPNNTLDDMMDYFHRTHHVQTIQITGLNPRELGELVSQMMEEPPSTRFIDRLYRETQGNPFLALEIVRSILETSRTLEMHETTLNLPLPTSVQALLRNRLNRLDRESRLILLLGAVLGNQFSLDLLQSILEWDLRSKPQALEPLTQSRFLLPDNENRPDGVNLQFAHEIMRKVVLDEASPVTLQILHRRVAEHLSQNPQAASQSAVIADHFISGGDINHAFNWYLEAAQHAWSLGAREDVLLAYKKAENLLKNSPKGFINSDDIFRLYQQWCTFAYQSNQINLLEELGTKLHYLGFREKDPSLQGISQIALGNACFMREEYDPGLELIEKAIENFTPTDNHEILLEALLRKGTLQWWKLDYEGAIQTSQKMLGLIEKQDSNTPRMRSFILNARHLEGMVYFGQGDANKALKTAREIYQEYFHKLNPFDRIRSLNMLAFAHHLAKEDMTCVAYASEALEIAQKLDNPFVEGILLILISRARAVDGHFDEAYQEAVRALEIGEALHHRYLTVSANSVLGDIFMVLRNDTRALQHYRVAQVRAGYSNDTHHGLTNDVHLARLLCWTGQVEEAREIAKTTLDATRQKNMSDLLVQILMVKSTLDLNENNIAAAEETLKETAEITQAKGLGYEYLYCLYREAQIALSRQNYDKAAEILMDVFKEACIHNMIWLLLNCIELYGLFPEERQDPKQKQIFRTDLERILEILEKHTQSDPLRQDFINARRYWLDCLS